MVQVPIIQQEQTRPLPAPVLGNSIRSVSDPYVAPAGQTNFAKAIGDIAEKSYQRGNEIALTGAEKQLNDFENSAFYDPQTGYLSKKGKDAFGGADEVMQQYQQQVQQIHDSLANSDQQMAFTKAAESRMAGLKRMGYAHERGQMDSWGDQTINATKESFINRAALNYNQPGIVDSSIEAIKTNNRLLGKKNGLAPETVDMMNADDEGKTRYSVLTRMADGNPKAALDYYKSNVSGFGKYLLEANKLMQPTQNKVEAQDILGKIATTPPASQDQAISFVINNLEGGDKLGTDSNGAAVKFGINQAAHPDVNVATLDETGAKKIAGDEYWKHFGIDGLPKVMQLPVLAFSFTNKEQVPKMLEEANGDPYKFIELNAKFYQSLAEKNPEKHGPSLPGWMNRLAKVKAQVDGMFGELPSVADAYAKIDAETSNSEVADAAKALYKKQFDLVEQGKKQQQNDAEQKVYSYDVRGEEPPVSLIGQLSPQKQIERQQKNYDPVEYERIRRQVSFGQPVDLGEYRWRFAPGQLDQLTKMQGDPTMQATQREVDKQASDNLKMVVGRDEAKTKEDYAQIDRYRAVMNNSIQSYERTSGKKATVDDVKRIGKEQALSPSHSFWSDDQQDVTGIPRARGQYTVNGAPATYAQIISVLSAQAADDGLPVTSDILSGYYKNALKSGQLIDKYSNYNPQTPKK